MPEVEVIKVKTYHRGLSLDHESGKNNVVIAVVPEDDENVVRIFTCAPTHNEPRRAVEWYARHHLGISEFLLSQHDTGEWDKYDFDIRKRS